jgi:hypothetical protein
MAYPANLAPGTPSAKYNITALKSGPRFVQVKNLSYFDVSSALGSCLIDMPNYDESVTRDNVNAGLLGRGPVSVITSNTINPDPFSGDLLLPTGSTPLPFSDEIATMMQQDDNFTHVAPHQNVLGRTLMLWYDDVLCVGNLVGRCWADQYIDEGASPQQFVGGTPIPAVATV